MLRTSLAISAAALAIATPASAQDIFTNGVSISDSNGAVADLYVNDKTVLDGNVCIGDGCLTSEAFSELVRLKFSNTSILFEDTSSPSGSFPSNDWQLQINDNSSGGENYFAIEDVTGGTAPFRVNAAATTNTLVVDETGHVGINTAFPMQELHIVSTGQSGIRMDSGTTYWGLRAAAQYFTLRDANTNQSILIMYDGTRQYTIGTDADGVGINTNNPTTQLHVVSDEPGDLSGLGAVLVENADAAVTPRVMLNLKNNGRPDIIMANTSTGGEWSFGAGTNFVLKQGAVGSTGAAKTKLFEVKSNGDATVIGTLTTGGTTCGGGCDAVFTEDYDLPSISEHAAAMYALGHLPNVGPTIENQPINVSDKLGRMLNELEHAHIYIAELEGKVSRIPEMEARLAALEAALADR